MFKNLKTKNIHIVGVSGAEGSAVLEFMARNGAKNITAHDFSADIEELRKNFSKTHLWLKGKNRKEAFKKFLKLPMDLRLKDRYLEGVLGADIIFVPQGWRLYSHNFPLLPGAVKKGIEFSSITKLYFQLAKGKIISVTGTKGKGTTARLIYEILSNTAENREVFLAGNDRRSAQELDKISRMKKGDILILETSNRQLMDDLGRSPEIGIITNISPDHIDEHGSFENYIEAKKSLFRHADKGDIAVLNYDNEITRNIGEELSKRKTEVHFFSRKERVKKGAFVENGKIYFKKEAKNHVSGLEACDLADIKLIGEHNTENVLAAVLAGYLAGATPEEIKSAVSKFSGLQHRLEFIGECDGIHPVRSFNLSKLLLSNMRRKPLSLKNQKKMQSFSRTSSGVKFYDDLASTNPESTIAAINALRPKKLHATTYNLILIAGGDDKGMDYSGLAKEIVDKVDTLILLPGTGTDKLKSQFSIFNFQFSNKFHLPNPKKSHIIECNDFLRALEIIKTQTKTGDTVLISPACAHFQARYIDILKKPLRNLIVEKFNLSS